jgi:hypothetical protein
MTQPRFCAGNQALVSHTRVGRPQSTMCFLTSEIETSLRWKIPAASAADAPVPWNTCEKWPASPAPEDAITGIDTAEATDSTRSRSKPCKRATLVSSWGSHRWVQLAALTAEWSCLFVTNSGWRTGSYRCSEMLHGNHH